MKKLVSLLLVLLLALSLCACVSQADVDAAREEGYAQGLAENQAALEEAQAALADAKAGQNDAYTEGYADGVAAVENEIIKITVEDVDWIVENLNPETAEQATYFVYGWNSARDGIYRGLGRNESIGWTVDDVPDTLTQGGYAYSIYADNGVSNAPGSESNG